jgi:hypothetical protein
LPADGARLPDASWLAVAVSLLLGAASHLAWDAFTHPSAPVVRALDVLRAPLFAVGSYQVFTYKVLQHGGTLLGVLASSGGCGAGRAMRRPEPSRTVSCHRSGAGSSPQP